MWVRMRLSCGVGWRCEGKEKMQKNMLFGGEMFINSRTFARELPSCLVMSSVGSWVGDEVFRGGWLGV